MRHRGWPSLGICAMLGALIVACTTTQSITPYQPPTFPPSITLTLLTPGNTPPPTLPGLPITTTLTPIPRSRTVVSSENAQTPQFIPPFMPHELIRTPPPLTLSTPTCYETADAGVLCMGEIENTQPYPIEQVSIDVDITDQTGRLLETQQVFIEQNIILPGETAPYRALFPNTDRLSPLSDQFGGVFTTLIRAEQTIMPINEADVLKIDVQRGEIVEQDRYIFTGVLNNTGGHPIEDVQVVITLYDSEQRVAGYRIVEVKEIKVGEEIPLYTEITPQIVGVPLHYGVQVGYRCIKRADAECQP